MGNAEPVDSPTSENPDGEVREYAAVKDMELTNDILGVVAEGNLKIGSLDQITGEGAKSYDFPDACGDLTANAGKFVAVCDQKVRIFDQDSERGFVPEEPVTSAAVLSDGRIVAGSTETEKVWVYSAEGEKQASFGVARPSDYVVAGELPDGWAYAGKEGSDAVVRVNRFDTTIQDIHVDKKRGGGTLRVGLGVGQVTTGREGLVLASDTTGNQLFVYTTDEVIRLHQTVPTEPSPYAVAWDDHRSLAWAASTGSNVATGYDLSKGVPVASASVATIANARHMVVLNDGTIIFASSSGEGLQVLAPETVEKEGSS